MGSAIDGCLAEGQLQRTEAVAQRAGVHVADLRSPGGDEPGEGVDELARLVQVGLIRRVVGESHLDGGGAHEVHSRCGDDLDGGHVRDVAGG